MTPSAAGCWPAVLFYGDAGGIRPAMVDMAQLLAEAGYVVLLPDPFYRFGPYEPLVPVEVFKGDVMAILGPLIATTSNRKAAEDVGAFINFLDSTGLVKGMKMGAVGFCMGGGMAITGAATEPTRFAAVASFHGGNLATDDTTSPHRVVCDLDAAVLVVCAESDPTSPPAMIARLEDSLINAGVEFDVQTYAGAVHGWMVPDFPAYDPANAERGWKSLLGFFHSKLDV